MTTVVSIRGKGEAGEDYLVRDTVSSSPSHLSGSGHSSSSVRSMSWRKTKIGSSVCLGLIGLALLIIGIILPGIVDGIIEQEVYDTVFLDTRLMTPSALTRFMEGPTNVDYYIYHVTNLHEVLTGQTDEPLNFQEVGPLKTKKYQYKYNVSYNADRSEVSYYQADEFEPVMDEVMTEWLNQEVVVPNAFYFAAGATVMQQMMAMKTGQLTSNFTNGRLNDQFTLMGFISMVLMPGVAQQFEDKDSDLMQQLRPASMGAYLQFAYGYWAQAMMPLGVAWDDVLLQWTDPELTPRLMEVDEVHWKGFGLPAALQSTDPLKVAQSFFDVSNGGSPGNMGGLSLWGQLAAGDMSVVPALMLVLSIDNPADLSIIGAWIAAHTSTHDTGYEKAVCAAIGAQIAQAHAGGGDFATAFADPASFTPNSWAELGRLQFGSGLVVGAPTVFTTGKGESMRSLMSDITGPASMLNFDNLATSAWGGAEPPEFTAAIQYVIDKEGLTVDRSGFPAGASQSMLWTLNPSLLFVPGTSDVIIPLTIEQSKDLLDAIVYDMTPGSGDALLLPALAGTLLTLLQKYQEAFMSQFNPADMTTLPTAIGAGQTMVAGVLAAARADPTVAPAIKSVTEDNWYAIFTYLMYLANELAGPLSLLDPLKGGVAPQNMGMFTRVKVSDLLFGYNARFPDNWVPGIAGTRKGTKTKQQLINEDWEKKKTGLVITQYTGINHPELVGYFKQYDGVAAYRTYCDLRDPKGAIPGLCDNAMTKGMNNYVIIDGAAPQVITGTSDGMNVGPLKEGDANILPEIPMFVVEAQRTVPLKYKGPTVTKGINLRRYVINESILVADAQPDNPWKNNDRYRQWFAPDGFVSIQPIQDGIPAFLSQPRFGPWAKDVNAGVTCTDLLTSTPKPCPETFNLTRHDTFVDVEPFTGLTMNGHKRLQANFRITSAEYFTAGGGDEASYTLEPDTTHNDVGFNGLNFHWNNLFKNHHTLFLPWYWADLHDVVSDADKMDFDDSYATVKSARQMGSDFEIAGIVVGVIAIIASAASLTYIFYFFPRRK